MFHLTRNSLFLTFKNYVRSCGFDLVRYGSKEMGINPYSDMRLLLDKRSHQPTIFDIGANVGESVDSLKSFFPNSIVHSFEPNISSYKLLSLHCKGYSNVYTYNQGLGSSVSDLIFYSNEYPFLSSFLEGGRYSYGKILNQSLLNIQSSDSILYESNEISPNIIKIDVQGFELEVLRGSSRLLQSKSVDLIHIELTYSEMYVNQPSFLEIINLLLSHEYVFVGIYRQHFQDNVLSWADALFASKYLLKK